MLCAPSDEEAEFLATSSRMAFTMLRRGQLIAGALAREGQRRGWSARGAPGRAWGRSQGGRRTIVGSPEKVRAGIEEAASEYRADEVIVVTITHDHAARLRSYELVADAMGLEPRLASAQTAPAAA